MSAPDKGGSDSRCPRCGSEDVSDRQGHIRPDGDDRPPFLMVCEVCAMEWEEDA